jgi:hypothetical protein
MQRPILFTVFVASALAVTVVLARDVHEHGLREGDLGAVVEVYEPDGLEVEFVTASGRTAALLTLNNRGRPPGPRRRPGVCQDVPPLGLRSTDNNAFHLTAALASARPPAGECERRYDFHCQGPP